MTRAAFAITMIDCLLWSCGSKATGAVVVSYSALCRLCHVARATVAEGLRVLETLGVLSRIRRRIRSGWRSLQATSRYVLHVPSTEFSRPPVSQIDRVEITQCRMPRSQRPRWPSLGDNA